MATNNTQVSTLPPLVVEAPTGFAFANAPVARTADGAALLEAADGVDGLAPAPGRLDEDAPVDAVDPEPGGLVVGAAVGRPSIRAMDLAVPVLQTSPAPAPTCCQVLPVTFNVVAAYVSFLLPWLGALRNMRS